jgi:hypothetical protein
MWTPPTWLGADPVVPEYPDVVHVPWASYPAGQRGSAPPVLAQYRRLAWDAILAAAFQQSPPRSTVWGYVHPRHSSDPRVLGRGVPAGGVAFPFGSDRMAGYRAYTWAQSFGPRWSGSYMYAAAFAPDEAFDLDGVHAPARPFAEWIDPAYFH